MKYFVIIKENSERVHEKNFQEINGLPLWKYLINELDGQDVYIDTDSDQVIKECQDIDVTCYRRLDTHILLENDIEFKISPVLLMIDRFLNEYVKDENEIVITPHVTSPFLKLETIQKAVKKLEEGYDSVQSCTSHNEFAYFRGNPINFDPLVVQKTQDLEPIVLGNGAFFIFTKKTFKELNNRIGKNPYFYKLNMPESIEIDDYEDLELARRWFNGNN